MAFVSWKIHVICLLKYKLPKMCELTDQIHTITVIMQKDTYSEKWFKVLTFNNVVFTWKNCKRRDKTLKNDLGPKKMVFGYFYMYLQEI